jgi:hypothetical protein
MVVETVQGSTADDRECWKAEGSAKLLRMEGLASWEEGIWIGNKTQIDGSCQSTQSVER